MLASSVDSHFYRLFVIAVCLYGFAPFGFHLCVYVAFGLCLFVFVACSPYACFLIFQATTYYDVVRRLFAGACAGKSYWLQVSFASVV